MASHAAKSSNPLSSLPIFAQRMLEQVGVAFVTAFFALLLASGSPSKSAFAAAATAGLRAAYGVVAKYLGPDPTSPSIK